MLVGPWLARARATASPGQSSSLLASARAKTPAFVEHLDVRRVCGGCTTRCNPIAGGHAGTAIGAMFARNGHQVTILDRNEERCKAINETHMNPTYVKASGTCCACACTPCTRDCLAHASSTRRGWLAGQQPARR